MFLRASLSALLTFSVLAAFAQHASKFNREQAQVILQNVAADIRKYYYDPTLRGVDWDAKVSEIKEKIAKATPEQAAAMFPFEWPKR